MYILYNKDGTMLVAVPKARTDISVLPTVTQIGDHAFRWNMATSVTLPVDGADVYWIEMPKIG